MFTDYLRHIILSFCIALISYPLAAQLDDLRFHQLDLNQDLPNCNIEKAVEDQYGFLWFASCEGLFRYDGYEFKAFRHDVNDSTSLSNPYIQALHNDKKGNLWAGTPNGLDLLDRRTGKFQRFKPDPAKNSTKINNHVRNIVEDQHGDLLFSSGQRIIKFVVKDRKFIILPNLDQEGSTRHSIRMLWKDSKGMIWAGTSNGLLKLNASTSAYEHILPDPNQQSLYNKLIHCMLPSTDGFIWLGTKGGLVRWHPKSHQLEASFLPKNLSKLPVTNLMEDSQGNIWVTFSNKGLAVWDKHTKQCYYYTYQANKINGLLHNRIFCLLEDRFQNIWVCTALGICKIPQANAGFQLVKNRSGISNAANHVVRVLQDRKQNIWTKTVEGLYKLEPGAAAAKWIDLKGTGQSYTIGSWFWEDPSGGIWTSIEGNGIYHLAPGKSDFQKLSLGDTLGRATIYKLIPDASDSSHVWIGTSKGLCKLNWLTRKQHWYIPTHDIPTAVSNKVSIFEQYGTDEIWMYLTYFNSLAKFDKRSGVFKEFRPPPAQQKLLEGSVKDIAISKEGTVWIANYFGLTTFHIPTQSFGIYTKRDGLSESELITILLDQDEKLWICGHRFLASFDPQEKHFQNFPISKKIKSFVSKSKYITADGQLFFGSINGIYTFHPNKITKNQTTPEIVLTGFKVKDEPQVLDVPLEEVREIVLPHDENDLIFEFAGLHFINPQANQYQCKLEGYNEKWQHLGREHKAVYANLNHGQYVFKVRAANSDGVWNEQGLQIQLIIMPAFWQTAWFKALIVLMLLSIGYALFKNRQHQLALKREKELAEQTAEYKSRFLADISHEIRTPMNAIIGLSKLILDTPLDKQQSKFINTIRQSSKNLLTIINDLLDHSKLEAGKFTFVEKPFDVSTIVSQLKGIFEHKATAKQLQFEVKMDTDLPDRIIGDPVRLSQILTNLLGNAFKFTEHGKVWLLVNKQREEDREAWLCFEVGDTGVGIEQKQIESIFESYVQAGHQKNAIKGTGLGLSIARQLVEKQGGRLEIESVAGKGTRLWFTLPYAKALPEQVVQSPSNGNYFLENLNILVVEDTYFNQLLVEEILKKYISNVKITLAENGKIALQQLKKQPFDIILMDIKMPVMNGYETTTHIRAMENSNRATVPILALTASAMPEQLQQCKAVGMNDYVTKPIEEHMLIQKIHLLTQNGVG